jgi:ankyrin repeat protein
MEQQQIIQQLQAQNQQLLQQLEHAQQQLQQYQQQENAPPAEDQQVEEQHDEPPVPPPQLPETSDAMESACCEGDVAKIISLIEAGESPNSVGDNGFAYTPVMLAISRRELSAVKVLFGFGADLSIVDEDGYNALHIAARMCKNEAINWVLDNGAIDINSTTADGYSAVMYAMADGELDSVMLLFERGALLSTVDNNGDSLLHDAVRSGSNECVNFLLENSAIDVNTAATNGTTPMTVALSRSDLASAKLLVEKGANLFMKNDEGEREIDTRPWLLQNAALLGPQVLLHAKELRWSAIKDFLLLSKACQSQDRRVATDTTLSVDEGDATILSRSRSVRLAASIFAIPGLLRLVGSYIIRSDIIVRDKSIPKPKDAVKLRVEAALKAAADKKRVTVEQTKA